MKNILFICTGNTCRSPMAEAIFRELYGEKFNVSSAGLFAADDYPAAEEAIIALKEINIDLSGHRSRGFTPEMLTETDIFVPMTKSHEASLLSAGVPAEKIHTIGHIEDPIGGNSEIYKKCAALLRERLSELYEKIIRN